MNDELKRRGSYSAWLGITDHRSEGNWVLESTGQHLTFSAWRQNEPNNNGGGKEEHCCITSSEDKKWNDVQCDVSDNGFLIVCEYV